MHMNSLSLRNNQVEVRDSLVEKLWPDQHKINIESLVMAMVSVALARSNFNRGLLIILC